MKGLLAQLLVPSLRTSAILIAAALVASFNPACKSPSAKKQLALAPCYLSQPGGTERVAAECGTVTVPENRDAIGGRDIDLFAAVLPATGSPVADDPLFLLAGGPGGAITREFPRIASLFGRINVRRDLVLLDQRGTGRSHALACRANNANARDESASELSERLKTCLAGLDADPRYYGTPEAVADLEAARAALGYEQLNLYGGSYGTRVALAYARAYPTRVRAMVLDGVVPFGIPLGPNLAQDAQRALDGLFARCAAQASCRDAFADPSGDLRQLLTRLESPVKLTMVHPSTGEPLTLMFSRRVAANSIRMLSYASESASILPLLIHNAAAGNLAPLAAQSYLLDQLLALDEGVHFSVICSEDVPLFGTLNDRGTYLEGLLGQDYAIACADWPHKTVASSFHDPAQSDAPTLLLSGELDPVTPPANAELARATLPRSRHLVLKGEAHGILHRGCVAQIVANFLEQAEPSQLDLSCLNGHRPLAFFTSFKGPEP